MGGLFQFYGYDEEEDDNFYNRQRINGEDEEEKPSDYSSPSDGFFDNDGE